MEEQNDTIKIRGFQLLNDKGIIPVRSTSKSSGYDIHSAEDLVIYPGDVLLLNTGITAYMLDDEELQIRSRSGLALNFIFVLNAPGTIDADYYPREIKVMLCNGSDEHYVIHKGDRIAQAVFAKFLKADDDQADGVRAGGFGHTGK